MPEDCAELEQAAERASQAVAAREAELAEAVAQAAALDRQLNALADSWSQGAHEGDWHEYGYALEESWLQAQRDLDAAQADTDGSAGTAEQLEQAWADLEQALAEAHALEDAWLSVMEQLSGDAPTDMGVPQSALMDRATDLREQLDAALARVEECHRRIAELTTRAQEDGAAAVEAAQAALDAADDARQNWMDASRDLIEEREAVPVDVRTRALESARTAELEALARWEVHCVDDPEFEDEGEDGGGTDTGLGEEAGDG